MDWASLNGQQVISARVTLPYYGAPTADVIVSGDTPIAALATLRLGSLTMVGYAARQGAYAGTWTMRLVGGYGGWRRRVGAQAYKSDVGVTRSMLLNDAAASVGEVVVVESDVSVGTHFVRKAAPASRLLRQVAGSLWYVALDGTTHVGAVRSSTPIASDFVVLEANPARGSYLLAAENLADWTPGRTFTSPFVSGLITISSVTHRVVHDQHRVEVLSTDAGATIDEEGDVSASDRILRSFRELTAAEDVDHTGVWEYEVQAGTSQTSVYASPSGVGSGAAVAHLPDLIGVPLLPGILGERVVLATGSKCYVIFINNDPSRPMVVGGDYDSPPTLSRLALGTKGAARLDDTTTGGTITWTSVETPPASGIFLLTLRYTPPDGAPATFMTILAPGLVVTPPGTPPGPPGSLPLLGKINSASVKVQIG